MISRFRRPSRQWFSLVVAVATVYGLLEGLDAPTPPLFGGLIGAIVVAVVHRAPSGLPSPLSRGAQAIIGTTVAAQIDVTAMRSLGSDWPAVAGASLLTIAMSVAIGQVLRLHGVSSVTAVFATIAGGASGMTAIAKDYGADERVVIVVQYFRVLFILLTLPLAVTIVFSPENIASTSGADPSTHALDWGYLTLTMISGVILGRVARLPSPALFGSLIGGGFIGQWRWFDDVTVPAVAQAAAFVVIGVQAGVRFTPDTVRALLRMFPTVLLLAALLVVACGAAGALLASLTGESQLDGYLATSPGGLPVVLATSSETAGNVTFVSAAQVFRMVAVLLLTPIAAEGVVRWRRRGD